MCENLKMILKIVILFIASLRCSLSLASNSGFQSTSENHQFVLGKTNRAGPPGYPICTTPVVFLDIALTPKPKVTLASTTLTKLSTLTVTPTTTSTSTETLTLYTDATIELSTVTFTLTPDVYVASTEIVMTSEDIITKTVYNTLTLPSTSTVYSPTATVTYPSTTITVVAAGGVVASQTLTETVVETSTPSETLKFTATYSQSSYDIFFTTVTTTNIVPITEVSIVQAGLPYPPASPNVVTETDIYGRYTDGQSVPLAFATTANLCAATVSKTSFVTDSAPLEILRMVTTLVTEDVYTITGITTTEFITPPLPTTTKTVVTAVNFVEFTGSRVEYTVAGTETIGVVTTVWMGVETVFVTPTTFITETVTTTFIPISINPTPSFAIEYPYYSEAVAGFVESLEANPPTLTYVAIENVATPGIVPQMTVVQTQMNIYGGGMCSMCVTCLG